jgi:hypothetical protein
VELNGALKHRLHASGSLSVVPKQRSIASFYRGGEKNSGSEPIQELESTKPSEVGEATTMQVPHVDSATQSTKMDDEAINSETVDKEDDVDDGDEDEGESEPRDRNAMYKALISQDSKKEKLRRKASPHHGPHVSSYFVFFFSLFKESYPFRRSDMGSLTTRPRSLKTRTRSLALGTLALRVPPITKAGMMTNVSRSKRTISTTSWMSSQMAKAMNRVLPRHEFSRTRKKTRSHVLR